jgi:cell cycle checkpoint protein
MLRNSFIPIAHTFVIKALASIVQRHNTNHPKGSVAGSTKDPNLHLIAATCNGDLRSAINSLQMLKTGLRLDIASAGSKRKRIPLGGDEIGSVVNKVKGRGSRGGKGAKLEADEGVRAA